jgi:antitoxin MazE
MEATKMKTTAQKWGNSLAIRVPKSIAQQAGLKVKDDLDIEVRKGALVLRPHLRRVYRLDDLVKRITQRNVHMEIDFGGPVGREAL